MKSEGRKSLLKGGKQKCFTVHSAFASDGMKPSWLTCKTDKFSWLFPVKNRGGESQELNITREEISLFLRGVTCRMNALQTNTWDDQHAPPHRSYIFCPLNKWELVAPSSSSRWDTLQTTWAGKQSPVLWYQSRRICTNLSEKPHCEIPSVDTHQLKKPNGRKSKWNYPTLLSPCSFSPVPTQFSPNWFRVRFGADMYSIYSSFLDFTAC